jgi:hypothetical protein
VTLQGDIPVPVTSATARRQCGSAQKASRPVMAGA